MELQYFNLQTFSIASQPHCGGYMKGEETPEPPQPRGKGHAIRKCNHVLIPLWPNLDILMC